MVLEKTKVVAIEMYDYEFAVHEAIPRFLWVHKRKRIKTAHPIP